MLAIGWLAKRTRASRRPDRADRLVVRRRRRDPGGRRDSRHRLRGRRLLVLEPRRHREGAGRQAVRLVGEDRSCPGRSSSPAARAASTRARPRRSTRSRRCGRPVLLIHSRQDGFTPYTMSEKIYAASDKARTRIVIPSWTAAARRVVHAGPGRVHEHRRRVPERVQAAVRGAARCLTARSSAPRSTSGGSRPTSAPIAPRSRLVAGPRRERAARRRRLGRRTLRASSRRSRRWACRRCGSRC